MWQDIRSGIRRFAILAAGVLFAMACLAGNAKVYAQTAINDSVLLDPFDPVPQIGFHHGEYGDCYDPCGQRGCYHSCGERRGCEHDCYRHAGCEHDCRRPCEHDCGPYAEYYAAIDRYNRQADMWSMLANIYIDEVHEYDRRFGGGRHHDVTWHEDGRGPDGDHHDGDDHHDAHDGDHHDGDGPHDGADRHDGDDHHDGHDGDGHDDHHHDGQWQDSDGKWHDGPPPNGYGH
jgi:hypothetical protein